MNENLGICGEKPGSDIIGLWRNASTGSIMYDTNNKRLLGTAELLFYRYRVMGVDQINTKIGYTDYDGHNQAKIGVELYFRKPAISTPNFMMAFDYIQQSVNLTATDTSHLLREAGRFNILSAEGRFTNDSGNIFKYDIGAKVKQVSQTMEYDDPGTKDRISFGLIDADRNAATLTVDGNLTYRFSRRGSAHVRGWYGQILSGEDEIPAQHKFWLSGGTDADFSSRVGTWGSSSWPFGVYDAMYIPDDGPGLRARHYETMGTGGFALNFDLAGVLPVDLFADVAISSSANYYDAGISFNLGIATVIMPVWASWYTDDDKFLKNMRLQIDL